MRVLLTTQPAYGHLHPLVRLARALERGGHGVAFACAPAFAPAVERLGLRRDADRADGRRGLRVGALTVRAAERASTVALGSGAASRPC